MPKLKLTIAYVGTNYSGWQIQAYKDKPQPITIQAILEQEISRICDVKTHILGSGRTDAGVHADCQTAHCIIPENRRNLNWQMALNTCLPFDIRIKEACIVHDDFHSMRDVVRKAYTYTLWLDKKFTPPKIYPYSWTCGALNLDLVDEAIPYLLGTHDFKSFQTSGTDLKSTVRTLYSIDRSPYDPSHGDHSINLRFEGNGFLRQMVRNMTGLLVACGRARVSPSSIPDIFAAYDRRKCPTAAPAKGLCMSQVWYKVDEASPKNIT